MPKRFETKVNSNAGKGARYRGGPGEHMGTNNIAPGSTVSLNARIGRQAHAPGRANGRSPMDRSTQSRGRLAPTGGPGNSAEVQGGGLNTTFLPAGDKPRREVTGE